MSSKASESLDSFKNRNSIIKHFRKKSEVFGVSSDTDNTSLRSSNSSINTYSTFAASSNNSSTTPKDTSPLPSSRSLTRLQTSRSVPKDLSGLAPAPLPAQTTHQRSDKKSSDYIKRVIRLYKKLDHGLAKFDSKQNGISKTNILRVTLLPFLRTNCNDTLLYTSFNKQITQTAINCLIKWWSSLLLLLRSTSHPISSSDRAVYLECISRIVTRKEWRLASVKFQKLLTETLEYSISRLNLKNLSLSTSAFVGKIFAYSFFYLPEVSTLLLFLLGVKQILVENLSNQVFKHNNQVNKYQTMEEAASQIGKNFPVHVKHLVGYKGKPLVPRCEKKFMNSMMAPLKPVQGIADPKGLWVKRWCSFDSDVFCSFLRHYLHIASDLMVLSLENESNANSFSVTLLPWNVMALCPGMMVILAHFLEIMNDSIMLRCKKNPQKLNKEKDFNISILNQLDPSMSSKLNKLIDPVTNIANNVVKIMLALRDYLHNSYDENEMLMAPFVIHLFDHVLQCYASKVSAYNAEVSGYILDIVYEFMSNVVKKSKDTKSSMLFILSIDWNFWICALQNMLETANINCELKLLSTLFNMWDLLPSFNFHYNYGKLPKWFINDQESIKWNVTTWLVSLPVFDKYFCHWQPLVRSYYHRLICWRLIVFTNSELSEQDQSIRRIIESRLHAVFDNLSDLVADLDQKQLKIPEMSLSSPMANRKIVINRILQNNELFIPDTFQNEVLTLPTNLNNNISRRIHAYEIFDDAIYCSNNTIDPKLKKSSPAYGGNGSRSFSSPLGSPSTPVSATVRKISKTASSTSFMGTALKFFRKPSIVTEKNLTEEEEEDDEDEEDERREPVETSTARDSTLLQPSPQSSSSRLSLLTPPSTLSKTFSSLSLSSRSSSPSLMSLSNHNSPPSSSISDISDLDSLDFREDNEEFNEEDVDSANLPLPPELDKRAPEISRPIYKFQLVFNDNGYQRQIQVIKDTKFIHGNNNLNKDNTEDIPKSVKLPNLKKLLYKDASQYYYSSSSSTSSTTDEESLAEQALQMDNSDLSCMDSDDDMIFITRRPLQLRKFEFANSNVSYIGRGINEWNLIVSELENFVDKYLSSGGDLRHIDKIIPYLDLEYPNKAVNAY